MSKYGDWGTDSLDPKPPTGQRVGTGLCRGQEGCQSEDDFCHKGIEPGQELVCPAKLCADTSALERSGFFSPARAGDDHPFGSLDGADKAFRAQRGPGAMAGREPA